VMMRVMMMSVVLLEVSLLELSQRPMPPYHCNTKLD